MPDSYHHSTRKTRNMSVINMEKKNINNLLIEEIRAPSTMEGSEGLLAIIIRAEYEVKEGVTFFSPEGSAQQLGLLSHKKGKVIEPHIHRIQERTIKDTQEVLIIRKGSLLVFLYTSDSKLVVWKRLYTGDVIHLISGGHALRMETDCEILEIKQGNYLGKMDKIPLFPKASPSNCIVVN